jgi:hypothetical protein
MSHEMLSKVTQVHCIIMWSSSVVVQYMAMVAEDRRIHKVSSPLAYV